MNVKQGYQDSQSVRHFVLGVHRHEMNVISLLIVKQFDFTNE